jgi:branched-chain amino acid transport system substrate-binding protein
VGKIAFNKNHQVVYGDDPQQSAVTLAFQWRGGKRVLVYPENSAESQIEVGGK